jgi:hypothetical protein
MIFSSRKGLANRREAIVGKETFKAFKSFNRFAPFKTLSDIKVPLVPNVPRFAVPGVYLRTGAFKYLKTFRIDSVQPFQRFQSIQWVPNV